MVLRLATKPTIENLRNYSTETVEKLRGLLAAGAAAQADPRRKNFFEVEDNSEVFYIHITPTKNKVLLLATWHKDCPQAT